MLARGLKLKEVHIIYFMHTHRWLTGIVHWPIYFWYCTRWSRRGKAPETQGASSIWWWVEACWAHDEATSGMLSIQNLRRDIVGDSLSACRWCSTGIFLWK
jgi:hypothetical protein